MNEQALELEAPELPDAKEEYAEVARNIKTLLTEHPELVPRATESLQGVLEVRMMSLCW